MHWVIELEQEGIIIPVGVQVIGLIVLLCSTRLIFGFHVFHQYLIRHCALVSIGLHIMLHYNNTYLSIYNHVTIIICA